MVDTPPISREAILAAQAVCMRIARQAAEQAVGWALAQAEAELARLRSCVEATQPMQARLVELEADTARVRNERHQYAVQLEEQVRALAQERDGLRAQLAQATTVLTPPARKRRKG
jgi:hypothetical protein